MKPSFSFGGLLRRGVAIRGQSLSTPRRWLARFGASIDEPSDSRSDPTRTTPQARDRAAPTPPADTPGAGDDEPSLSESELLRDDAQEVNSTTSSQAKSVGSGDARSDIRGWPRPERTNRQGSDNETSQPLSSNTRRPRVSCNDLCSLRPGPLSQPTARPLCSGRMSRLGVFFDAQWV